jgi:hypothetical protein
MLDQKKNEDKVANVMQVDAELEALLKQLEEMKPNVAQDTEVASKVKNEISVTPAKHTDQSKLPYKQSVNHFVSV